MIESQRSGGIDEQEQMGMADTYRRPFGSTVRGPGRRIDVRGHAVRPGLAAISATLTLVLVAAVTPACVPSPDPGTPKPIPATFESLVAATPAGAPDSDSDGIPDPVEAILGTNPNLADSDGDTLEDKFEVTNDLDPSALDSNDDGLADNFELEGPADLDGDGTPNAWDDDNDGDGVRDGPDLNPGAASVEVPRVTVDLQTTGQASYLDVQVRPSDLSHLTLPAAEWDWPADQEGTIRDLADRVGEADVRIVPMLQLRSASGPDDADLASYGIVEVLPNSAAGEPPDSWKALVPLVPVQDRGVNVALKGRVFYPDGTVPGQLTAELVWVVSAPTDAPSMTRFVATFTAAQREVISTNGWPPRPDRLEFDSPGDQAGAAAAECPVSEVAETSVPGADAALAFTCAEPLTGGVNFVVGDEFSAHFDAPGAASFDGVVAEVPADEGAGAVARYTEDFVLTGIEATESLQIEAGIAHATDRDQVVGAGLALDYQYLRSQQSLTEAFDGLAGLGLTEVGTQLVPATHADGALNAAAGSLPGAFDGVAAVFTVLGERSATRPPSEWDSPSPRHDSTRLTLDLRDPSLATTTKVMSLSWYDQSTRSTLSDEQVVAQLEQWDVPADSADAVALLTTIWQAGEIHVTEVGGTEVQAPPAEAQQVIDLVGIGVDSGALLLDGGRVLGLALTTGISNWRLLKQAGTLAESGWSVSLKGMNLSRLSKLKVGLANTWGVVAANKSPLGGATKFGKTMRTLSKVGKAATYAALVLGLVQWGLIWANDFTFEGFMAGFGAFSLVALTTAVFVVLAELGAICAATIGVGCVVAGIVGVSLAVIGGVLLLLDWIFDWGWWDKVEKWWNGLWTTRRTPLVDFGLEATSEPKLELQDLDDNGFDVGDRVRLQSSMRRSQWSTGSVHTRYSHVWWSGVFPGLVGEVCVAGADGQPSCPPPDACPNGDDPGYFQCHTDLADVVSRRTDLGTTFSPADLEDYVELGFPSALGNKFCNSRCRIEVDSDLELLTTPRRATTDLQLSVGMAHSGKVYAWNSRPWWDWRPDYVTLESFEDDGTAEQRTLHFDVLPGSLDEFLEWDVPTATDPDRDGAIGSDDPDPDRLDADEDGVPDGVELVIDTDPADPDSDDDGLRDGDELRRRTDPSDRDSDDDGLSDREEVDGWDISFTYGGRAFTSRVAADPLERDLDGDGLDDLRERHLGLDPRSWDTDGDGVRDGQLPMSTVSSVRGSVRTDDGGVLTVDLSRTQLWFGLATVWAGTVRYRDVQRQQDIAANVLTTDAVVQPMPEVPQGARVRVPAVDFGTLPLRTGTLDLSVTDEAAPTPDHLRLTFGSTTVDEDAASGDIVIG